MLTEYFTSIWVRAFFVWCLIAAVETLHGILRARFLAPKVGDLRSRQIAIGTGSLLIFTISYWTIPWIGPETRSQAFQVGFLWVSCMTVFEFSIGHFVFGFSWKWLLNDFNIFKGRLLLLGMIFLGWAPILTATLRGLLKN